MRKSWATTLLLLVLLLGGAFLLYRSLFSGESTVALAGNSDDVSGGGSSSGSKSGSGLHASTNKGAMGLGVGNAVTSNGNLDANGVANATQFDANGNPIGAILLSDGGIRVQSGKTEDATPPVKRFQARVTSVSGKVETRGANGAWTNLDVGQALNTNDLVRTGRSGEANLDVGDGVKVRLSPRSEFSLQELGENLSRIRLAEGHVTASVDPNGNQILKVEAEGSDAVAQSSGGTFGMINDGKGQVAIATTTGSVKFTSKGKTVDVLAGTETSVTSTTAPSAPRPIPKSLLLKVAPESVKTRLRSTYVEGRTDPGSIVRVQGSPTKVDARGKFRVKVALRDGPNRVAVEVIDPSGRTRRKKLPPIIVDRTKPNINASMKWGEGVDTGG